MLMNIEIAAIAYLILSIVLLTFSNLGKVGGTFAFVINLIAIVALEYLLFQENSLTNQSYLQLSGNTLTLARLILGANLLVCLQYGQQRISNVKLGIISSVVSVLGVLAVGISNILLLIVLVEMISLFSIIFIAKSDRPRSRDVSIKQIFFNVLCTIIGFIALGLFYLATGNVNINDFEILHTGALQLSVLFFVTYFIARLGVFPFQTWVFDYLVNIDRKNLMSAILVERLSVVPVLYVTSYMLISRLPDASNEMWKHAFIAIAIITAVIAAFKGMGKCGFKRKAGALMLLHSGVLVGSFSLQFAYGLGREIVLYYVFTLIGITGLLSILNEANSTAKDHDVIYDGYYRVMPVSSFKLSIYLLSLAGFPMTVGFSTRYLVLVRYFSEGHIVAAVMMIAMMLLCLIFSFQMVINVYLNIPRTCKRDLNSTSLHGIKIMEWLFVILLIFGGHLATYV